MDAKEESVYAEYYIDTDEAGTLRETETNEILMDENNIVYTLQLLRHRDEIISNIIAQRDKIEDSLEEQRKNRMAPDANTEAIDKEIKTLTNSRREI
jgi:hypothetical protein